MFHIPAHKVPASQPQPGRIVPEHKVAAPRADFAFSDHGSICVLVPLSEEGNRWVRVNLPADVQRWAGGIAIEPRCVGDVLGGIAADALEVV